MYVIQLSGYYIVQVSQHRVDVRVQEPMLETVVVHDLDGAAVGPSLGANGGLDGSDDGVNEGCSDGVIVEVSDGSMLGSAEG